LVVVVLVVVVDIAIVEVHVPGVARIVLRTAFAAIATANE
jgi:hypothetical protein